MKKLKHILLYITRMRLKETLAVINLGIATILLYEHRVDLAIFYMLWAIFWSTMGDKPLERTYTITINGKDDMKELDRVLEQIKHERDARGV